MKKPLLAFTSAAEAGTGLLLMVSPPLAGRLLLGTELVGPGAVACRIAGAALVGLGVACWPGFTPLCGILTYSTLATIWLAVVALSGHGNGPLLWPAVAAHALLAALLGRAGLQSKSSNKNNKSV
jgi:hypothetical protein